MVEIQWYYSDTQKYNKNIWDQPYEKRKWIKLDMATIIKQSSCFVYSMIELHEFHIFYKKILFSEKNRFVSRITFNIPSRTSEMEFRPKSFRFSVLLSNDCTYVACTACISGTTGSEARVSNSARESRK